MRRKKLVRKSRKIRKALKGIPGYPGNPFVDAIKILKKPWELHDLLRGVHGIHIVSEDVGEYRVDHVFYNGDELFRITT